MHAASLHGIRDSNTQPVYIHPDTPGCLCFLVTLCFIRVMRHACLFGCHHGDRVAAPSRRPSRACAARAAALIAASITTASRKALLQKASEWDDSTSDGVEDEDDDDDREQNGALDKQTNRKGRRGSGDSDDSDMPPVHDDSEDSKAGESSESSDEENEVLVRRGPGRPRKAETPLKGPAKGKAAMKSGRGAKGTTASVPSTKAVRGKADCKENTKDKPSPDGSSAADAALVEKILCYDSKQDMFLTKLKGRLPSLCSLLPDTI